LIKLEIVKSDVQKNMVKRIIEKHHSYVPSHQSVGRRIDWLIYNDDTFPLEAVGMIGIGSSVYPPPKDMLRYMNLSKSQYKDVFNSVSNNWRFCMRKSIKNGGTQILKELRKLAPIAWKSKYGDDLKYLITFVGGGNNGAVYKADNWDMVGETAGLPKHKSSSMKWNTKEQLKKLFVKPTGEDKKLIFMRRL
tara:strand:- start:567 stop:1142 length:576 start_codon:yes stop_codon:yes gene_type:complete